MPSPSFNDPLDDETLEACSQKLAFATQKEAWTAATVARFQHGGGTRLKAYSCKVCKLWHLASKYD